VADIVPPRHVWEPIQYIRNFFFNNLLCGPHLTVLDPFVEYEYFDQAEEILAPMLKKVPPFQIILEKIGLFNQGTYYVVYLDPKTDPPNAIEIFHRTLLMAFPNCNRTLELSSNGIFAPHITVCKIPKSRITFDLEIVKNMINLPIVFPVNHFFFMYSKGNGKNPFQAIKALPLGENNIIPFFGPESNKLDMIGRSTLVLNLPSLVDSDEKFLLLFKDYEGLVNGELALNSNKSVRNMGVITFDLYENMMKAIDTYVNNEYPEIVLKELRLMMFPDVVGGSTTFKDKTLPFKEHGDYNPYRKKKEQ